MIIKENLNLRRIRSWLRGNRILKFGDLKGKVEAFGVLRLRMDDKRRVDDEGRKEAKERDEDFRPG